MEIAPRHSSIVLGFFFARSRRRWFWRAHIHPGVSHTDEASTTDGSMAKTGAPRLSPPADYYKTRHKPRDSLPDKTEKTNYASNIYCFYTCTCFDIFYTHGRRFRFHSGNSFFFLEVFVRLSLVIWNRGDLRRFPKNVYFKTPYQRNQGSEMRPKFKQETNKRNERSNVGYFPQHRPKNTSQT